MHISLSWLRQYLTTSLSLEELLALFTKAGIEIAGMKQAGVTATKVVVAQVDALEPHPNADRLKVCQVNDGSSITRQIVCGASNVAVGKKVPLALPGAVLPGGTKIKVGKLRGVESEGMLCGGDEIGLGVEGEGRKGLLILDPEAPLGTPLEEIFPPDTILEVETTPNRPDWLGHLGVARTLASFGAGTLSYEPAAIAPEGKNFEGSSFSLNVLVPELAPYYHLARLDQCNVKESPAWLAQRLEAVGIRSINNIVDVTSFVMMALGQPLHAFDAAKIKGGLEVRFARRGEKLLALNNKTYELTTDDLVIADETGPQALAGVIGGKASAVSSSTTSLILEGAVFSPTTVRATLRRHHLATDASYRFERGTTPIMVREGVGLAVELLTQIADVEVPPTRVVFGKIPPPRELSLSTKQVAQLLGKPITDGELRKLLEKLGCSHTDGKWQVPSYRIDLQRPVDLIEDIAHLIGMEKIPAAIESLATSMSLADRRYSQRLLLKRQMVALGFFETPTSSLVPEGSEDFPERAIRVRNPLNQYQVELRSSFSQGLFSVLKKNRSHGADSIRIFEIGKIFGAPTWRDPSNQSEEFWGMGMLLSGEAFPPSWRSERSRKVDFFDLKGVTDLIIGEKITYLPWEEELPSWLSKALKVTLEGIFLGYIGLVKPTLIRELAPKGAQDPIMIGELDLSYWDYVTALPEPKSVTLSNHPMIKRDFALLLPRDLPYGAVETVLKEAKEPLLQKILLFDILEQASSKGEYHLPEGKKSITLSLIFQDASRTLTSEEVDTICQDLLERLERDLGVVLRS